jgi:Flp pilus assembly protein TadG
MMKRIALPQLWRNQQGLAAVEFALSLPLLVVLLFGSVEVTRYIVIMQKLEKVSSTLSDVVAQSQTMSTAKLDQIVTAAAEVMRPYSFSADGYAVISSVSKTGTNNPIIDWQYRGGGSYTQTSRVGATVGGTATMPNSFVMVSSENVIVAEVFYQYRPLLTGVILPNSQFYRVSIYKPRLGELRTLSWLLPAHTPAQESVS